MCSYREKKAEPQELLQLDGYTVDYTDPQPGTGWRLRGCPAHRSQRDSSLLPSLFLSSSQIVISIILNIFVFVINYA